MRKHFYTHISQRIRYDNIGVNFMDVLSELPLGFSMALAKNPDALQRFSQLPDEEKRSVINGTHKINSKTEMQEYVNKITKEFKA